MKNYYVYMLTNWTGDVMYIGMTNDLERRLAEHQSKAVSGFTKQYNLTKLVYYEQAADVQAAIAREKQLKNWSRQKKDRLVETMNPEWEDLAERWYEDPSAALGMTGEGIAV
ncbi:MAG: GIY-YIG nuclease family protein [Rhodospirillales bacterium]|nr:GIY-YIG nuclease family protein [Rhodospirillales bacterium]MCB9996924.1 GIY-YIG nuclease family protein [Rhodospirillales bacterium]